MRCTSCGNTRFFFLAGKEVRRVDTANPYEVESFFVPTSAVCMNPSCASFQKAGSVELGPLHPDLVGVADALALRS